MYIGDFHIHSRYSRATSRELNPSQLDLWARKKGIDILGTGDFTHPAWRKELSEALVPVEPGLYILKEELRITEGAPSSSRIPRFVISGEISSIYKKNERTRKVHSLILLPGLKEAEELSRRLEAIGNIHSDGRPILGLDCHDLLALTLEVCPEAIYVPAHIWTPHFSLFGAFSGFDTIEECFEELTPEIHALETGLSSDPAMNWRLSALDGFHLISNSDAHSPAKLGREANLLDIDMSYQGLYGAIQRGQGLMGTIEFFPEEGKYHFDGHRKCHLCLTPSEAERLKGICPVCGKKLTTGVLHRIEQLADRKEGFALSSGRPYENLIPLPEVIGAALGTSAASVKTARHYEQGLNELGNEFYILRQAPLGDIRDVLGRLTAEGVRHLREGHVEWRPGYDGEYGTMKLFQSAELEDVEGQLSLFGDSGLEGSASVAVPAQTKAAAETPAAAASACAAGTGPDGALLSASAKASPSATPAPAPLPFSSVGTKAAAGPAFSDLNPNQFQAVASILPVTAVIAGPGTGKTKTLVARLAWLMGERGVKPSEITAVTFTSKAAGELKERIRSQLPGKRSIGQMQIGTFHSLCYRMLKETGLSLELADDAQKEAAAAQTIEALDLPCSVKQLLTELSLEKSGIHILSEEASSYYNGLLKAQGLMDFDDLLLYTIKLLQEEKRTEYRKQHFSYLLVDEFQDISPMQYRLIRAWNKGMKEIFVIGDPDQSIYGFRGSDSQCFDRLLEDYPQTAVIRLLSNYRSSPQILGAALPLISCNPGGERQLSPVLPDRGPVRLVTAESGLSEAIFIAKEINRMVGGMDMLDAHNRDFRPDERTYSFSEIAILYRTNHQARLLEQCLQKEDIPYTVAGREDYLEDMAVRGILTFFHGLILRSQQAEDTPQGSPSPALPDERSAPSAHAKQLPTALAPIRPDALLCQARQLLLKAGSSITVSMTDELAAAFLPRLKKERPWKMLEEIASASGFSSHKPVEQLICMSYFHKTMADMLYTLSFGSEGDLQRKGRPSYSSDAVRLMTFHASKGLEFPAVFLYGLKQGILPLSSSKGSVDTEEERRLFYVAMTRAKEELILSCSEEPSPFMADIPESSYIREQAKGNGPKIKQLSLFDMGL